MKSDERARSRSAGFVANVAGILATRALLSVVGIATGVITARLLGPHDRGLFALLLLLPQTLTTFGKMGIAQASVYHIRHRRENAGEVASNALVLASVISLLTFALCYFGYDWFLAPLFKREAEPTHVAVVLVLVPFLLAETYFLGILQAEERFRVFNMQSLYKALLSLVALAVALVILRRGLLAALWAQVAAIVLVNLWLLVKVYRIAPFRLRWSGPSGFGMLRFGAKSYVQTLATHLHFKSDQYLIALFLAPSDVAFYSIAANLMGPILQIPDAVGTVLFPKLAASSSADASRRAQVMCRYTLFATAVAAVIYAIGGSQCLPLLYGERYAPAIRPMLIMLPGVVMMSIYHILTRNFTSQNKQEINIAVGLTALGLNFCLNLVLIPRLGIAGAAAATAVSYSIASLLLLAAFVRRSGLGLADTLLVRLDDLVALRTAAFAVGGRLRGAQVR